MPQNAAPLVLVECEALCKYLDRLARITGVASILARLAAPCIAQLLRSHPGISFDVVEDGTSRCVPTVVDGGADIGICVLGERPPQGTFVHPLVSDRYGVVASKKHPVFAEKQLSVRSLAAWNFISAPMMGDLSETLDSLLTPRVRLNNLATVAPLLEGGAGVSIFPYIGAQRILNKNLSFRPFDDPKLSRHLGLVRRRDRSLSPAAQLLWDLMVEQAAELLGDGSGKDQAGMVTMPPRLL